MPVAPPADDDGIPYSVPFAACACAGCCVYRMSPNLTFTWSGLPVVSPCAYDLNGTWQGAMNEAGTQAYQTTFPTPPSIPVVLCGTNPDRYRYPAGVYCNIFSGGGGGFNMTCQNGTDTPTFYYNIQRNTFADCDDFPCLYSGINEFYTVDIYGADKVLSRAKDGNCCVYSLRWRQGYSRQAYNCSGQFTGQADTTYTYGTCTLRICPSGSYGPSQQSGTAAPPDLSASWEQL